MQFVSRSKKYVTAARAAEAKPDGEIQVTPKTTIACARGRRVSEREVRLARANWSYRFPGAPSILHELKHGGGYWVLVDDNFKDTLAGYPSASPPLNKDWNLIGINSTIPVPIGDFILGVSSNVSYIYGFDNELKEYSYWIADIGGTLTILQPREGY